MDLIRLISRLFHEQAEEAKRIVIITKNTSKKEIEKFKKDIEKEKNESEIPGKSKLGSPNTPDRI